MKVASLFSGVGTFDYGFQMAGWESVHLCEWDPKAREVLTHRFPGVPLTDNVLTLSGAEMTPADCVMFGSPCQDLSVAGKGAGLNVENYAAYKAASAEARRMKDADPFSLTGRERLWLDEFESNRTRSGLFFEAIRIIEEMREATDDLYPRFALWENVPGAFSSNGGRDFAAVVQSFLHIGARDVSWRVLDSQHFGVPQRRRRIFLVADFGGECAEEILFEPKGLQRHPVQSRKAGQGITGTLTGSFASSSAGNPDDNRAQQGFLIASAGGEALVKCLTTGTGKRYDAETETLIPVAFDCLTSYPQGSNDISPTLLAGTVADGGRGRAIAALPLPSLAHGAIASTLTTEEAQRSPRGDGSDNLVLAFDCKASVSRDPMIGTVSPTLEAQDKSAVLTNYAVRRLTPEECEALQGMPRGWTDVDGMADSHRYRFMGNGGTSFVLTWIAERMARVLA